VPYPLRFIASLTGYVFHLRSENIIKCFGVNEFDNKSALTVKEYDQPPVPYPRRFIDCY